MSHSVHRLHMASVKLSGKFNPPSYEDTRINVYAYLVLIGPKVLLVDTGIGDENAHIDKSFEPRRNSIVEELKKIGIETTDVSLIVNSHLHFDHCGNNQFFPNAKIFVQEAELEVARTSLYTVRDWFDYDGANIVPVVGDTRISEGVHLLSTPGHTPGHQSLLVESDAGRSMVAAQAAFRAEEYLRGGDPNEQAHEGLNGDYIASIARLKMISADKVYFSHDTETPIQL